MSNPRHAAPRRTAVLASRVALGVVGAPVAMMAIAGTASASPLDSFDADDNRLAIQADGSSFEASGELSELALPELESPGAAAVPGFDAVDVEALSLDALGLGALGLDALGFDALPGTDSLPGLDALPGTDSLPGLDALPGTDSLPGLDALPGTDSLPGIDAVEQPLALQSDLDGAAGSGSLPAGTDVFSASDLLGGII